VSVTYNPWPTFGPFRKLQSSISLWAAAWDNRNVARMVALLERPRTDEPGDTHNGDDARPAAKVSKPEMRRHAATTARGTVAV